MVNNEILGGLEVAVERGDSLRNAMMSFLNAGYKREEIEEAARALQMKQREPKELPEQKNKVPKKKEKIQKVPIKKPEKKKDVRYVQGVSNYEAPAPTKKPVKPKGPHKISNYGEKPKSSGKILIIVMIAVVLLLLGVLASVFFFRQELIDLFGKLI